MGFRVHSSGNNLHLDTHISVEEIRRVCRIRDFKAEYMIPCQMSKESFSQCCKRLIGVLFLDTIAWGILASFCIGRSQRKSCF